MIRTKNLITCIFAGLLTAIITCTASATPLVSAGDQLVFSKATLTDSAAVKNVEWSQSFRSRKEKYVQVTAAVKSDKPYLVMLFIAQGFVPILQEKCKNDKCMMKVDSRFQYGQNKEKTMRFLVFHEKSNKPYQHRFISTSTLSTFANGAESVAKNAQSLGVIVPQAGLLAATGGKIVSGLKSVLGDPLRDF